MEAAGKGVVAQCRPRVALLEHVGRVLEAKLFRGQVLSRSCRCGLQRIGGGLQGQKKGALTGVHEEGKAADRILAPLPRICYGTEKALGTTDILDLSTFCCSHTYN